MTPARSPRTDLIRLIAERIVAECAAEARLVKVETSPQRKHNADHEPTRRDPRRHLLPV